MSGVQPIKHGGQWYVPGKGTPVPLDQHIHTQGGRVRFRGVGLLVRFSPVKGHTPRAVLDRKIWLPAILGAWTITESATHNEYDTLSDGQFSMAAQGGTNARELRDTSFDTLTMIFDPHWITASNQDPHFLRARLSEILRSKKPVRVLAHLWPHPGPHPELDMHCTFRSLSRELRPGETDTRYATLTIKEWRDPAVRRRTHTARKRDVQRLPTTHVLKATDTLASLSHEYYGTYRHWRYIRDANHMPKRFGQKTPIVKLPGPFKVGHKIKIPEIPADEGLTPTLRGSSW